MEPIEINLSIDLAAIKRDIEEAKELNDNDNMFMRLAQIARAKAEVKAALELVESLEQDIKGTINTKAKALYGDTWTAIKGDNYKITRSGTGAVYETTGDVEETFLSIKVSVNADAVKKYIKENATLPDGIGYSKVRGEALRITVKDDVETDSSQA